MNPRPSFHPFIPFYEPITCLFRVWNQIHCVASYAGKHCNFSCFHYLLFALPNRDVAALVTMSEGILKPEKDYSKDADKLIPEAELLAKVWKWNVLCVVCCADAD